MKNFLLKVQSQFQKYWQNLSNQQKIVVSGLALIMLSSIVAGSFYISKPSMVPLFSNLSQEDAGGIITKLKESKIQFEITDGGRTIKVPEKDLYETRLALAGQGIPQGGSIGFEIFDKSFFGMTEFNQRLNYQRAMQGELERTIRQVSSVEQARVHLVLPEKTLYSDKEKEPTASVVLKLKPGARLEKAQVKAIVNLVKTSVEGLKDNNISIVDTNGRILSSVYDEEGFSFTPEIVNSQFELKKLAERNVRDEVSSMLDRVLGPGKAVVSVNVDLDLTKKEATAEIYTPVDENKKAGIARSVQEKSENFKGSGASAAAGIPGTTSNVGNVPGFQQQGSSGGSTDFTKDETITNYEINKKVEHSISVPGEIKKLSISVLLDGTYPEATMTSIKQAVSSAIGINLARGDSIVVESMAFDKTFAEKEKQEMDKSSQKDLIMSAVRIGSVLLVTIIIILFGLSMLRHRQVIKTSTEEIGKGHDVMEQQGLIGDSGVVQQQPPSLAALDQTDDIGQQVGEQIAQLAKDKPERIAEVIKDLISGV